jgi:hypothetical protein
MRKVFIFLLVVFCAVLLFGCSSNIESKTNEKKNDANSEPNIIGYVMKKEDGRILVINPEPKDFSSTGRVQEFYDAIWFSNAPIDIELGDKVKVWFESVRESYPGQSEIKRIKVINDQKLKDADITEPKALHRALTSQETNDNDLIAVKLIEYDNKEDRWNIRLKVLSGDIMYDIHIEDE